MTTLKYKDILDTFTESFPLLEKIYEVYDKTPEISTDQENTLRRSIEMTTLELLELIVVASRQGYQAKKETLKQCAHKLDTLKVFVDLGIQTGTIPEKQGEGIQESVQQVGKMIGGWIKKINEASKKDSE